MSRGGIESAVVQTYDAEGCVTGFAVQVTGDLGLTCAECVGDDLLVQGDVAAIGSMGAASINSGGQVMVMNGELWGHVLNGADAIDATAQVLIPVGFVSQYVRCDAIASDGTTRGFLGFALQHGGTMTQNIVAGTATLTYRLNGDGSVDVRRTAGAGTGATSFRAMWI